MCAAAVAGTAGQTAPVYRAGFHPHSLLGLKHDCPFPIFSLPISDSFTVSFYIQKGIVQEKSELLCNFVLLTQRRSLDTPHSHSVLQTWGTKVSGHTKYLYSNSIQLLCMSHLLVALRRGGRTEQLDWHLSSGDKNSKSPL